MGTEFLKVAIMQPHDHAKCLKICANFSLMNAKQESLHLFLMFVTTWQSVPVFMAFFKHVSAKKNISENSECAKEFTFRKSEWPQLYKNKRKYTFWYLVVCNITAKPLNTYLREMYGQFYLTTSNITNSF